MEAAPLFGTPAAPVPGGGEAFWLTGAGGTRLRAATFAAEGARGSVVLSPGRVEPIEKYFEVVDELRARGFSVLVHDWRGQGLSDRLGPSRLHGHAGRADDFLADHRRLLDAFGDRLPRPWIGLGHSMGGGLLALALVEGEARLSGAVLSAPLTAVKELEPFGAFGPVLVGALAAAGLGGRFARGQDYDPLLDRFEEARLTRDRGRYERFKDQLNAYPELALAGATWGWLAFACEVSRRLARPGAAEAVAVPVTAVLAEDETLVVNAATQAFVRRLRRGRIVTVPGALHEILMETDARRAAFWAAFDALADEVLKVSPTA